MGILVIGSSNTDLTVYAESLPKPGETVHGNRFVVHAGGKGANQAVGAARLGAEVTFSCMLGDDGYGREAIAGFSREGIDTSYVFRCPEQPSGVALITIDRNGENCIAVAGGANLRYRPEDVDRIADFPDYRLVLTQLEIPLPTVVHIGETCRRQGLPLVLNPAPAQSLPESLLRNVSIITPNETEAEILTGIAVRDCASAENAAKILAGKGVGAVVITMGSRGAFVFENGASCFVEAYKVEAVDTTAAGDIFNGALCVALSQGRGLLDAVRFASAASAIAVTRCGAQCSAPYAEEVAEFMRNN